MLAKWFFLLLCNVLSHFHLRPISSTHSPLDLWLWKKGSNREPPFSFFFSCAFFCFFRLLKRFEWMFWNAWDLIQLIEWMEMKKNIYIISENTKRNNLCTEKRDCCNHDIAVVYGPLFECYLIFFFHFQLNTERLSTSMWNGNNNSDEMKIDDRVKI